MSWFGLSRYQAPAYNDSSSSAFFSEQDHNYDIVIPLPEYNPDNYVVIITYSLLLLLQIPI